MTKPISDKRAVQDGKCYSENLDNELAREQAMYDEQCDGLSKTVLSIHHRRPNFL
jgi:hypothetical protein